MKSSLSKANGTAATSAGNGSGNDENQCTVREQDRFMPIANVIRIMRKVLPTHAKISDDAKETIQECVSEYISFITSEANERCQLEQRKTITAEDVLWAMSKLGFDDYVEPLSVYLHRYRELEGEHRGSIRGEPFQFKRVAMAAGALPPALQSGNNHTAAAVGIYGTGPSALSYHLPTITHPLHHHLGVYGSLAGDGVGGYYLGAMHGDPAVDSSKSPAINFGPYASYR